MAPDLVAGLTGVLLGGIFNGSFVAPMKKMTRWSWEASWFVYSVFGLLVIPWAVALVVIPDLWQLYRTAPGALLAEVLAYGFGWGVGSVLFGIGVSRMGLAVGYGIILGLIAPIGTFYPLIALYPERLWTRQGRTLMLGTLIVLAGILFCARAGRIRERVVGAVSTAATGSNFAVALLICVLAGVFSPMLNFTFVFGAPLRDQALAQGVAAGLASNAIWPLALTAGSVANAGYAAWRLSRNRTWGQFRDAPASHWIGGIAMGLLCFASFMVYGLGATALGRLGGVVGWPLFMSMALITSNSLGALTGEWRGAPRSAWAYSIAGIAVLVIAIAVIATGGQA